MRVRVLPRAGVADQGARLLDRLIAVFVGGAAGALARALVAEAVGSHDPGSWPWATLIVNVLGAFLLGYVVTHLPRQRALLGAGFCGALTTFSTMQVELLWMLDDGAIGLAVAYAAVSVALGSAAVALGRRTA